MVYCVIMKTWLSTLTIFLASAHAAAQSFNIDFGVSGNNVVPSSAYGAAANQSGFWNAVRPVGQMRDLSGTLTSMTVGGSGGGTFQGNIAGATGDELAMMSDCVAGNVLVGDESSFVSFGGLQAGQYRCFIYGWNPDSSSPGYGQYRMWDGQQVQLNFTSSWPGQQVLNQTYFTKDLTVTNASERFRVTMIGLGSDAVPRATVINGLQIVMIPAPASVAPLGLLALAARRRRG